MEGVFSCQLYNGLVLLLQNDPSWADLKPSNTRDIVKISNVLVPQLGKSVYKKWSIHWVNTQNKWSYVIKVSKFCFRIPCSMFPWNLKRHKENKNFLETENRQNLLIVKKMFITKFTIKSINVMNSLALNLVCCLCYNTCFHLEQNISYQNPNLLLGSSQDVTCPNIVLHLQVNMRLIPLGKGQLQASLDCFTKM